MTKQPAFMNWHKTPDTTGYIFANYYLQYTEVDFNSTVWIDRKQYEVGGFDKPFRKPFIVSELNQIVFTALKGCLNRVIGMLDNDINEIGGLDEWLQYADVINPNEDMERTVKDYNELKNLLPSLNSFRDFPKDLKLKINFSFSEWDIYSWYSLNIDVENESYDIVYGDSNEGNYGGGLLIYPTESVYREVNQ